MRVFNCPRRINIRLISLIVFLIYAHEGYTETTKNNTRTYSVNIAGCPSRLKLQLPNYFSRAVTLNEIQDRNNIISNLHSNPARKARYSEIFLTDWGSKETLPMIMVYSLGALIKRQGKINDNEWYKLKSHFLKLTEAQRNKISRDGAMRLAENSDISFDIISARISSITDSKENSIVILGESRGTVLGQVVSVVNAGKMIYSKNCIVSITAAVDATLADSFMLLTNIISEVDIK